MKINYFMIYKIIYDKSIVDNIRVKNMNVCNSNPEFVGHPFVSDILKYDPYNFCIN